TKAEDHEKLSQALLEYETLSGEEIKDLLEKGVAPNRDENNFPNAGPSVSVPVTPVDEASVEVPPTPAATSVPTVH
ncbi:cell division protein FtsH, partial [Mesorhizobium japonicum]